MSYLARNDTFWCTRATFTGNERLKQVGKEDDATVAVGVVARRAERSAASVVETRFTEALRRTRSGATRQPTASNPFVVKVREKYPAVHVPDSIGLIGLP